MTAHHGVWGQRTRELEKKTRITGEPKWFWVHSNFLSGRVLTLEGENSSRRRILGRNAEEVVATIAPRDIFLAVPELYLKIYRPEEYIDIDASSVATCNECLANERYEPAQ